MLKVCGVTFDKTMNYGSCLQAYALQTIIEQQAVGGFNRCQYSLLPIMSMRGYPKAKGIKELRNRLADALRFMFRSFEKKHMHYAQCDSIENLGELNNEYDAFVCGSDVIWSPQFNKGVNAYYLKFANKYAFSYAASFGRAKLSDEEKKELKQNLSQLKRIGVRETTAERMIEAYTERLAETVLDPVLLLEKNKWDTIAYRQDNKVPYIFLYVTHFTSEIDEYIKALKIETGFPVITVTTGFVNTMKTKKICIPSPQRWLSLLKHADYVVTNSFHATAFSVIYHKRFFTVMHGEKAGGINVRMYDFLHELGLEDRLLNVVPDVLNLDEIDYTRADARLEELRKESMAFLQENLEAAYQEKLRLEQKEQ